MKKKNITIIILIVSLVVFAGSTILYKALQDENKLTLTEKKYISEKNSNLISINVINDSNVFGNAGQGVFYDFLEDFKTDRELKFNIITKAMNSTMTGLSLANSNKVPEGAKVFYTDHFVLVSKKEKNIATLENLSGTVGFLSKDSGTLNKYINNYSLTNKAYETKDTLLNALTKSEVEYILVPMFEYLDTILDNLYVINFHLGDAKNYYYLSMGNDETLNSILTKYYNKWMEKEFTNSFDTHEFYTFTKNLKITEKELDMISSKDYIIGYTENAPYIIKSGGSTGGIVNEYLTRFTDFSGLEFEYKEYKNYSKLNKAIANQKIDLYLNDYNYTSNYQNLKSLYNMEISFIMNDNDIRVFTSLESIKNETIYVLENSKAHSYLLGQGIKVITFKNVQNVKKIMKENNIIALDSESYLTLNKGKKLKINERFTIITDITYDISSKADTMFNRLLSYYISTIDKNEIKYAGITNYNSTSKSGALVQNIVKIAGTIIFVIVTGTYIVFKYNSRIRIRNKIKKNEKIKYIDMLTSLKNRNFLTENLQIWNQNTIYPQAIIVINLNSIQELNDTYGYLEGDKQIQSAANVLIKTQLDNTEIMRTDGNEFTIYMLGYNEKQVLSYIKKLNKEFKNLPHDKSAAIGFSMIEDDVKLIDDAINEATEQMKKNKELFQGEIIDEKI